MEIPKKTIETEEAKTEAPEAQTLVEKAEAAAARIEKAVNEHRALIEKDSAERAKALLGGRAPIAAQASPKTPEQEKKDKAMEFWKGTDIIEKAIAKHG